MLSFFTHRLCGVSPVYKACCISSQTTADYTATRTWLWRDYVTTRTSWTLIIFIWTHIATCIWLESTTLTTAISIYYMPRKVYKLSCVIVSLFTLSFTILSSQSVYLYIVCIEEPYFLLNLYRTVSRFSAWSWRSKDSYSGRQIMPRIEQNCRICSILYTLSIRNIQFMQCTLRSCMIKAISKKNIWCDSCQ